MAMNVHLSNAAAYAAAFDGLMSGASTVFDLAQESGLALNTTRKLLQAMRHRKMVHVAAWEKDALGRYTVAAYALGQRYDTRRPPPLTQAQRSARRDERKRKAACNAA